MQISNTTEKALRDALQAIAPNGTANWASASGLEKATYVYLDRQGQLW